MQTSFKNRLRTWREQRDFSFAEAAEYINSLHTGGRISPERLEEMEAGGTPTTGDRMLLEFFMSVTPPIRIKSTSPPAMAALV
jgi:hypothetical protein